jgi:CHAT domain-containing protein
VQHLSTPRLVVVPYQMLHYVPFHALYDGRSYALEHYEVSYAPSAGTLLHCLSAPRGPLKRAVLVGVTETSCPKCRVKSRHLHHSFPTP